MGMLERTLARTKGAFWTLLALVAGPPFLLLLFLIAGLVTDMDVRIDVALILFALVAGAALAALVHLMRYRMRPRETVSITYDMRLEQPPVPMGRYLFRLSVYYETVEKGQRKQVRQGEIEMRFKGKDHPDLLAWCCSQVQQHLERHREKATQLHPDAQVLVTPAPQPSQLAERTIELPSAGPARG
jgi:hypothetical protein